MATPVFPVGPGSPAWGWSGLKWGVEKIPNYDTRVQMAASGRRSATALRTAALWNFTLAWEFLHDLRTTAANVMPAAPQDELRQILGFFLAMKGRLTPFFFRDFTDNTVTSQQIGVGDGTTRSFQCVRSFAALFVEPVGGINTSLTNTFSGGSSPTLNSPLDGWVTFASAPTNATPIIWTTGNYYFKVAFKQDSSTFRNFAVDLWENQRVEFEGVRP